MNRWPGAAPSAMRRSMSKRRNAAAGGIFLFLGPILGAVIGIIRGELVPWMLYGFGAGVLLALLVWLIDRSRG